MMVETFKTNYRYYVTILITDFQIIYDSFGLLGLKQALSESCATRLNMTLLQLGSFFLVDHFLLSTSFIILYKLFFKSIVRTD